MDKLRRGMTFGRSVRRLAALVFILGPLALTGEAWSQSLTFTKSFNVSTIALNGTATLTFVVSNTSTTVTLTGVNFVDTLPPGLVVATPNNINGFCTGGSAGVASGTSGGSTTSLSNTTLVPSSQCTYSINVTGTTAGQKDNVVTVNSNQGATATASATIVVVAPSLTFTKSFNVSTIAVNGTAVLTFDVTNTSPGLTLTGVNFVDTLPAGLVVATPSNISGLCTGGSAGVASGNSGGSTTSLSNTTLVPSSHCTYSINVTGTTPGQKDNAVTVNSNEGATGTATASIAVRLPPPTISKAFGAATIPLSGSTTLSFTINNPNATTLTGVGFSDALPAGLVVSTPNGVTGSCGGGTITATAGSSSVSLAGATLAGGASCTFGVNVTGSTPGVQNNTTGAITSTESGSGATSNTATLTVVAPPTIAKAFGAPSIPLNSSTSLTITIQNPNATVALTGVAFTDTLPAGLVVATPNALTNSCGGTASAVAGSGSLSLTSGTIAAGGSCVVSVNVTVTTPGNKSNTTGSVASTNGGSGTSASATITAVAAPTIAKSFAPPVTYNGHTSTLTFTLTNPAANTVALTGVGFTDILPAGLGVASASVPVCGGTLTTTGPGSIVLSGATIAVSGTCQFNVTVSAVTIGNYTNTTGTVSSSNGGGGATASANLVVLDVALIPALDGWMLALLAIVLTGVGLLYLRD